jgi:predicted secreted protein
MGELKKRMEKEGLGERVVALETTGYLTDKQISAKIREYFKANPILNQKRAPVLSGKNTGVLKGNFRVVQ